MKRAGVLGRYRRMRDFDATSEPAGDVRASNDTALTFVIQRHAASHLHFDLRLELDGVLKSWAVPKGPSLVPGEKRLAVEVEDHPLAYGSFEGAIPEGQYGAGYVFVWDHGHWRPHGDPHVGLAKGHLSFDLEGDKLGGRFALVRSKSAGDGRSWLLFKAADAHALKTGDVAAAPRVPALSSFPPQLATLAKRLPAGDGWVVEPKLDGYRAVASIEGGKAHIVSRSGQVWTARFPGVRAALAGLDVTSAVVDGEVCALDEEGFPRFQALQEALSSKRRADLVYYVFDLLFLDGEDLRDRPLSTRKAMLASVLGAPKGPLAYVGDAPAKDGPRLLEAAKLRGLEGLVAKRADAPYRGARTKDWIKVKVTQRQEMVIVGASASKSVAGGIGALLVAVHDDGRLRYAGKVGTGFDKRTLAELARRLAPLAVDAPAAVGAKRARGVTWVKPELVAEIQFGEWTRDKKIRHASFVGLRDDKPAGEVVREGRGANPRDGEEPRAEKATRGVKITHADREIDGGVTKGDLADYMGAVADRLLPYAAKRPLALVRCPDGDLGKTFFQKQKMPGMPASIHAATVGGHPVLHVDSGEGLVSLVQFGAIELHGWGARLPGAKRPDWIVIDLDPDEGLAFARVAEAAFTVREALLSIGLESFPKTTGGKGLHVVAPMAPELPFEDVKRLTHAIALRLSHAEPDRFTAVMSKAARKGKIFVDYLRNGEGATAVLPFSPRARPGLPVAWPIAWRDVDRVDPAEFTVKTAAKHLKKKDPWRGFFGLEQRLPEAFRSGPAKAKAR